MQTNYKELMIESLAKDKDIYAYGSLLAFWEYTDKPENGFSEMPSKDYIHDKIRNSIIKDLEFIEVSIHEQDIPAEFVFENPGFYEFIYENTINALTASITELPVFKVETESNDTLKLQLDLSKDFVGNFHNNLLINRSIMRHITSAMILCGHINKNTNNDYDFISDKTYEIIHVVFESMNRRIETVLDTNKSSFSEYRTMIYLKGFSHSVVNKVSVKASVIDFERIIPIFIMELTGMNRRYVSQVFKEKAPLLVSIKKFINDIENTSNN
jgi:hypothetical protein